MGAERSGEGSRQRRHLVILVIITVLVVTLAPVLELSENLRAVFAPLGLWKLDGLQTVLIMIAIGAAGLASRRRREALGNKAPQTDSEARFRALFEQAPDAHYLHDLRGAFVAGNRAAEELIGYKRDELIGKSFLDLSLLGRGGLAKGAAHLARNALGKATGPSEFTLTRKDGSQVFVEIRTAPVTLGGRSLVLGSARDITERRDLERALRERTESFTAIVEANSDGILVTDKQDIVRFVNPAACRFVGRSRSELEGGRLELLCAAADKGYMAICRQGEDPGVGAIREMASSWGGDTATLFVIEDVTDRRDQDLLLAERARQQATVAEVGDLPQVLRPLRNS